MARKETDKQVNVTLSEANGSNLEEYCNQNNISRNAAMNRAVELLTLDRLRSSAPDQAAYIEEFEVVIDKILAQYRQAIERSLSADERARADVRAQLDGLGTLSKTNEKLENEKSELLKEKAELEHTVTTQKERITQLEADLTDRTNNENEIEVLKKKCSKLAQEKLDLLAKYNEEVAKLQEDNFAKILEVIKAGTR